ncbi:MAG: hypothetical protein Q7R35_18600 [Elusimicrobiota bacterium]|nr:hypothetical protein [Elusimicrobiota bacterium]
MSRGLLDDATLLAIHEQLPNLKELQSIVLRFSPDFIALKLGPKSFIPTAAVCLQDTSHTVSNARYALHEALAHEIWYLKTREVKSEIAAIFFSRFYLDDVALRLYSAGEHLSEAIVNIFEIKTADLRPYKEKMTSRQRILGNYLREKLPGHSITAEILKLADSKEWRETIKYRNDCVHSQPPLLKGLGISYRRRQRWTTSDNGNSYRLGIGGGDEPKYSVTDLLNFIKPSIFKFTGVFASVVDYYIALLEQKGITQSKAGYGLSTTIL